MFQSISPLRIHGLYAVRSDKFRIANCFVQRTGPWGLHIIRAERLCTLKVNLIDPRYSFPSARRRQFIIQSCQVLSNAQWKDVCNKIKYLISSSNYDIDDTTLNENITNFLQHSLFWEEKT